MSDALAKWLAKTKPNQPNDEKPEWERGLNGDEQKALVALQREAKKAGATLANGPDGPGTGGLPSSLVLGIFRRDADARGRFACKACGGHGERGNGLSVHHKGGDARSRWLSKMGHRTVPENFAVLCERCHDAVHRKAREDGTDSSQVTPKGDEGTRRDEGNPAARPAR